MINNFIEFYISKLKQFNKLVGENKLSVSILFFLIGILIPLQFIIVIIFLLILKLNKYKLIYILFLFTGFIYSANFHLQINKEYSRINSLSVFSGVIKEPPVSRSFNKELVVDLKDLNGNAMLTTNNNSTSSLSNVIEFSGHLELVENNSKFTEEYKRYLLSKNIHYYSENISINFVKENSNLIVNYLSKTRNELENISKKYLSENKSNLLNGINLGAKGNINNDLKSQLQSSGLSHIISASGYNIMILYSLIKLLRGRIPIKTYRVIAFTSILLSSAIIGLYILPIQRAFTMTLLLLASEMLGRKPNPLNSITISTLLIILQYPLYLYNISLQLSLAATIGLFYINPFLNSIFKVKKQILIVEYIHQTLLMSLSVVLATSPIIIFNFRTLNITGLISNIFILPLIPLLTILSLGTILMYIIHLSIMNYTLFFFIDMTLDILNQLTFFLSKLNLIIRDKRAAVSFVLLIIFICMILYYKTHLVHKFNIIRKYEAS